MFFVVIVTDNFIIERLLSFLACQFLWWEMNLRELKGNLNYKNLVTAILFVLDVTECQTQTGIRLSWQWQVGAVSGKALFSFRNIEAF